MAEKDTWRPIAEVLDTQKYASMEEGGMEKKVYDAMKKAGKPVRPGDVAEMLGRESKEISKVISELKKKGKVISPKRCYYSINE